MLHRHRYKLLLVETMYVLKENRTYLNGVCRICGKAKKIRYQFILSDEDGIRFILESVGWEPHPEDISWHHRLPL